MYMSVFSIMGIHMTIKIRKKIIAFKTKKNIPKMVREVEVFLMSLYLQDEA